MPAVPAAVRFLSCEPLLGPVSLRHVYHGETLTDALDGMSEVGVIDCGDRMVAVSPKYRNHARIDWVICGGESGPDARPMHPDWARSIRDQCVSAGVAFYFKQWGSRRVGELPHGDTCITWQDGSLEFYGDHQDIKYADHWLSNNNGRLVIAYPSSKKASGAMLDGREWRQMPEHANA